MRVKIQFNTNTQIFKESYEMEVELVLQRLKRLLMQPVGEGEDEVVAPICDSDQRTIGTIRLTGDDLCRGLRWAHIRS